MTVPLVMSTNVPDSGPSREEDLAAALELQRVEDGDNPWVVHVLGVHNDGHYLWAQVAPHPDGTQSIVLRLSMTATARHALAALATLSRSSFGGSAVVPVMCAV